MAARSYRTGARGYTYLWLLFFIAAMGGGLSIAATLWHTESVREREQDLLFAGNEIRRAIASYYEAEGAKQFPESLEELLDDKRSLSPRRHLRRLYRDPMTGTSEWGLIKTPGGSRIMGIFSLSDKPPAKVAGFEPRYAGFSQAQRYSDWKFAYSPGEALDVVAAKVAPQTPGDSNLGSVVSTILTPSPVITAPPLEPPKPKSRCEKIAEADQLACDQIGRRFDANTRAECLDSAQGRAAACAEGKSILPALYVRYF